MDEQTTLNARAFTVSVDDVRLVGEQVVPAAPRAAVILCHGLPSSAAADPTDPGYAGLARTVAAAGFAAIWFNFRGARSSSGDFSMLGWCRDLHAVIERARLEFEIPLVLVGSSMGGAASLVVAAQRDDIAGVATLAAVATPADEALGSREELLQRLHNAGVIRDPAFPRDVDSWSEEFRLADPSRHIEQIAPRPVLLVHGTADDVVPYHHAERLFELAGEPKELVRLDAAPHQLRRDGRAVAAVLDWLERWHGTPASPGRNA